MKKMKYADVIIDIRNIRLDRTFQYIVPDELEEFIHPGVCVLVPFGRSKSLRQGFVIGLSDSPAVSEDKLKTIESIDKNKVPVESQLIELADWMKRRYGGTMAQSLQTVWPVKKVVKRRNSGNDNDGASNGRDDFSRPEEHSLNTYQQQAVDAFKEDMNNGMHRIYLLFGVTGSGKTLVYIEMIRSVLARGLNAIVLIPEIALTRQNIMRFSSQFGDRVAVLHSRLSEGERYDVCQRALKGEVQIVLGPRSALFTPFSKLGLIIVDEEHETSYKSEQVPRYHARDVAIARAKQTGASVVLGSATPSIDSILNARNGSYKLLQLPERAGGSLLPEVNVIDMRQELAAGNRSMISQTLCDKLQETLNAKKQAMLFLNRRGMAGFVSCRSCGNVIKCPHCDVSLHLHRDNSLRCHYCGYHTVIPSSCPKCGSRHIGSFKAGTQSVERQLRIQFPQAAIIRMDADTTRHKGDHERLLEEFASKKADILIGTQMIVKGHDFPDVTLVGVLAADLSLNGGDYSGGERTFDLLVQASGRAGRGDFKGEVVIQTYQPDHYAIKAAAAMDVGEFVKQELSFRSLMGYPPVKHMLLIRVTSQNEENALGVSKAITRVIAAIPEKKKLLMANPTEAVIAKVKDSYRYAIYIKADSIDDLIRVKDAVEKFALGAEKQKEFTNTRLVFDFDPIGIF